MAIEYSEVVRPDDTEKAQSTITVGFFPDDRRPWAVDLGGRCPRCGHDQPESRHWLVAVAGASKFSQTQREQAEAEFAELDIDLSSGDESFDLRCGCSEKHAHRPHGKSGCGAAYRVRVVWAP
ncbi:hypothetical protein GCM10009630_10270 [Kribbella jejuensis]|uniref:Uncharacterized protein n=1 Tax=Kribbella jejuensis TaxID=236068 RepID=A0A542EA63_9ACTN|nr:hypothetical protein FB475_5159 [Kribbella jejuensis]